MALTTEGRSSRTFPVNSSFVATAKMGMTVCTPTMSPSEESQMVMARMNPWNWILHPNPNPKLNPKSKKGCRGQRSEVMEDVVEAEAEVEDPTATTMIYITPSSLLTLQPEEERGLPGTSGQAGLPQEVTDSPPPPCRGCRPGDPPGPPA